MSGRGVSFALPVAVDSKWVDVWCVCVDVSEKLLQVPVGF